MSDEIISPRIYFKNFGALIVLLLLTIGAAYLDLGPLNFVLAMLISLTKTALIALFFMHIRWGGKMLHLAAGAGLLWLGILLALTLGDYISRGWLPVAQH